MNQYPPETPAQAQSNALWDTFVLLPLVLVVAYKLVR